MRFATVETNNRLELAVQVNENLISLSSLGYTYHDMNELIEMITDEDIKQIELCLSLNKGEILEDYQWRAPIIYPRQDIICLGQNYKDHAEESIRYKKDAFSENREAIYFSKRVNQAVGHNEYIESNPLFVRDLDYECELAVIIRKDCRCTEKKDVKNHIFGYTIINDFTARTIQTSHKQWYFGKSLDTFTAMGPVIVTADEFQWPLSLSLTTHVNGEMRQNGNTKNMIYDIEHIICELSSGMTLKTCSIIATGTPAGVGMGMEPASFLSPNDIVVCSIEKIGELCSVIK